MEIGSSTNNMTMALQAMNQESFGAQVVTGTLDTMNGQNGGNDPVITDKQSFGAAVVSKTLDYMNSGDMGDRGMHSGYDFQASVLGAHYSGKGTQVNMSI